MRPHPASSHLFGCVVSFPHTSVVRTVAPLGYDMILIDAQHTAIDPENLVRLVQTANFCSEGSSLAVVRVPSVRSDLVTYALDAGMSRCTVLDRSHSPMTDMTLLVHRRRRYRVPAHRRC